VPPIAHGVDSIGSKVGANQLYPERIKPRGGHRREGSRRRARWPAGAPLAATAAEEASSAAQTPERGTPLSSHSHLPPLSPLRHRRGRQVPQTRPPSTTRWREDKIDAWDGSGLRQSSALGLATRYAVAAAGGGVAAAERPVTARGERWAGLDAEGRRGSGEPEGSRGFRARVDGQRAGTWI